MRRFGGVLGLTHWLEGTGRNVGAWSRGYGGQGAQNDIMRLTGLFASAFAKPPSPSLLRQRLRRPEGYEGPKGLRRTSRSE